MESHTLGNLIDVVGVKYFNKVAIALGQESMTYNELMKSANELAEGLLDLGIKKGDRVGVWMGNCLEWVYTFFAAAKIGAIIVPINTRFKVEETGYILQQCEISNFIVNDVFLNINFMDMTYELLPELRHPSSEKPNFKKFPSLRNIVSFSRSGKRYPGTFDFVDLMNRGLSAPSKKLSDIQSQVKLNDVALIQYTSGTTGFPKGAMLTHENFTRSGYYVGLRQELQESDRFFTVAPFFHTAGTMHAITAPLTFGTTVYSLERYDIEKILPSIEQNQCNVYHGFNMFKDISSGKDDMLKSRHRLRSLKRAWTTGSPDELKQIEDMGVGTICHIYGLTETTGCISLCSSNDPLSLRIHTVGKPLPGTEVCIKDPKRSNKILPLKQEGEICVRGWHVMKGYYNKPKETQEAIDEDGWLHCQDLGSLDADGNITFLGRIKDMIRVGGENVSPVDVEDFIRRNPKVQEVCIVGAPDKRLGEICMAFIKLTTGEKATEQEIIDYCKKRIANFKVPRHVKFVDEFPRAENNKIKRHELRKLAARE